MDFSLFFTFWSVRRCEVIWEIAHAMHLFIRRSWHFSGWIGRSHNMAMLWWQSSFNTEQNDYILPFFCGYTTPSSGVISPNNRCKLSQVLIGVNYHNIWGKRKCASKVSVKLERAEIWLLHMIFCLHQQTMSVVYDVISLQNVGIVTLYFFKMTEHCLSVLWLFVCSLQRFTPVFGQILICPSAVCHSKLTQTFGQITTRFMVNCSR